MDSNALKSAGFTDSEINEYNNLKSAGFSDAEIDAHYAQKSPASTAPEKQKEPGFFGRANESLVKRGVNISDELNQPSKGIIGDIVSAPRKAFHVAGETAGLINDLAGNVAGTAIEGVRKLNEGNSPSPEDILANILKPTKSPPLEAIGAAPQKLSEAYGKFEQNYPNASKDVNAAANLWSLLYGARPVATEAKNVASDIKGVLSTTTPEQAEKNISKTVSSDIERAIRPTVKGRQTAPMRQAYSQKATGAVKDIVENKGSLALGEEGAAKLPENLNEFSQAISQRKKQIFNQYDEMQRSAGNSGITISGDRAAAELKQLAEKPSLQATSPEVASHASSLADRIAGKEFSPGEVQDMIAELNQKIDYTNPANRGVSAANQLAANNLRASLDDAVTQASGPGYQELKNSYGNLSTIEKDVNNRANIKARNNTNGLPEMFGDMLSGAQAAHALISMNPSSMAAAGTMKGISMWQKMVRNPDRITRKMFEKVDRNINAESEFVPKSAIMKSGSNYDKQALEDILFNRNSRSNVPSVINPNFRTGKTYSTYEPNFTVSDAPNIPQRQIEGIPNRPQIGYEPNFVTTEQPKLPPPQKALPASAYTVTEAGTVLTPDDIQAIIKAKRMQGNLNPLDRMLIK